MRELLQQQLERLVKRLHIGYDSIGNSNRSPYGYCIYDPQDTRDLIALLPQHLRDELSLTFFLIDLLSLTIDSLRGQEQRRQELLEIHPINQAEAIEGIWSRRTKADIEYTFASITESERPVAVLYNTAALHPVSNPSSFIARIDEYSAPIHPKTGKSIPIIIFVPGFHPPYSSRSYYFLSKQHEPLTFYLGEEIW